MCIRDSQASDTWQVYFTGPASGLLQMLEVSFSEESDLSLHCFSTNQPVLTKRGHIYSSLHLSKIDCHRTTASYRTTAFLDEQSRAARSRAAVTAVLCPRDLRRGPAYAVQPNNRCKVKPAHAETMKGMWHESQHLRHERIHGFTKSLLTTI